MRVVSNSGPLIHLSWIQQLHLLHTLYGTILVPAVVQDEVLRVGDDILGVPALRQAFRSGWITVQSARKHDLAVAISSIVDRGEAEAISLAEEIDADLLLLDDLATRKLAQSRDRPIVGTIGVLRAAKDQGAIPAVTPLLLELQRTEFWISDALVTRIQNEETQR